LRALIPPMTPSVIFRAILGVLLFFCGIVLGFWLIFRFRRQIRP
jgi:positive regulator of sigma E activity